MKLTWLEEFWVSQLFQLARNRGVETSSRRGICEGVAAGRLAVQLRHRGWHWVKIVNLSVTSGGYRTVRLERGAGQRQIVSVLFADIVESTQLVSALDPEEAEGLLWSILDSLARAAESSGGYVDRILGDGLMVVFGAPSSSEDHAARACFAAEQMHRAVARGADARLRIGIHSGEVVVREHGDAIRVAGAVVHMASRVQSAAAPEQTLLTTDTLDLASGQARCTFLGNQEFVGFPRATGLYRLDSVRPVRDLRSERDASYVGRFLELSVVASSLDDGRIGHGCRITVKGEPGIGKTRFVREVLARRGSGWSVRRCGGSPFTQASAYYAASALVMDWFGVAISDSADQLRLSMRRGIERFQIDSSLHSTLSWLLAVEQIGPDSDSTRESVASSQVRRSVLRLLDCLISADGDDGRSALVVVEDGHWLDLESRELIDALGEYTDSRRFCLLTTSREHWVPSHQYLGDIRNIQLGPLQVSESVALAEELLAAAGLDAHWPQAIAGRADGNPLFIEELARAASLGTALEPDDQRVPPSIHVLYAARIDQLPEKSLALLRQAAVIGPQVTRQLLAAVAALSDAELDAGLAPLHAEHVLFPEPAESERLAFSHALLRDVAYQSLLHTDRKELHRRVVDAIESVFGERREEWTEPLARHAEAAELWAAAARYYREAGQRALRRAAFRDAAALLRSALASAAKVTAVDVRQLKLDIILELRRALAPLGRFPEVQAILDDASELAVGLETDAQLARIFMFQANVHNVCTNVQAAIQAAERALRLARRCQESELILAANAFLAQGLNLKGDSVQTLRLRAVGPSLLSGELRHARSVTTGTTSVLLLGTWVEAHAFLGDFDAAHRDCRLALEIANETQHPYDRAYITSIYGQVLLAQGAADEALPPLEEALAVARDAAIGFLHPLIATWLVLTQYRLGRRSAAAATVKAAIASARDAGVTAYLGWASAAGSLIWSRTDETAARNLLIEAEEIASRQGLGPLQLFAARVSARLSAREDVRRALKTAQSSLDRARVFQSLPNAAHALALLAELYVRAGEEARSRDFADAAQALYAGWARSSA